MKICPKCNRNTCVDTDKFCYYDGASLVEMAKCADCGRELSLEHDRFCAQCGRPVDKRVVVIGAA